MRVAPTIERENQRRFASWKREREVYARRGKERETHKELKEKGRKGYWVKMQVGGR